MVQRAPTPSCIPNDRYGYDELPDLGLYDPEPTVAKKPTHVRVLKKPPVIYDPPTPVRGGKRLL